MTDFIREQLILGIVSFVMGFVMAFLYDVVRVLRLFIPPSYPSKCIQDLFYWLLYSAVTYEIFLRYNYGGVRFFAIGILFAAMFLYYSYVSIFFVNYCVKALIFICKPIKLIVRLYKRERGQINDRWKTIRKGEKTKYRYSKSKQTQQVQEKKR
ncbi:MAG: spore cortex biosynthesis protein YabQ [Lachnospiraceae bacterium]|nr:spore cortex biosynthesis protein YabQ [Lachnospiraceae bacterium]